MNKITSKENQNNKKLLSIIEQQSEVIRAYIMLMRNQNELVSNLLDKLKDKTEHKNGE